MKYIVEYSFDHVEIHKVPENFSTIDFNHSEEFVLFGEAQRWAIKMLQDDISMFRLMVQDIKDTKKVNIKDFI